MAKNSSIVRAIKAAGSQHKLAELIGMSQHAVWHALNRRGQVSAEMAVKIEKALKSAVTAAELRPDLFGR